MIEHYRRMAFVQQMMHWDGTPDTATAIQEWVGAHPDGHGPAFLPAGEACATFGIDTPNALLWVVHNDQWIEVPVGHRIVRELDESGFYPLSPDGLRAGFEQWPVQCSCPRGQLHPQHVWTDPKCPIHAGPKVPRRA